MFDQLAVIIGVTFLALISPGPDLVLVARNTVAGTRRDGLLTSLGVLGGNLVHITYCVVGIGWLISQSILAFSVLKYAGALYLVWLGWRSFRAKPVPLDRLPVERRRADRNRFLQGFFTNLLNPKGTLFYLGVFTVVIEPGTSPAELAVLVATMMALCAGFWTVFVMTLDGQAVRGFFDRAQTAINRVFGAVLIALGIRVAFLER